MKKLVANWTPSVSTDIAKQELKLVRVRGAIENVIGTYDLNPTVSGWSSEDEGLTWGEGTTIRVEITVVDLAGQRSAMVSAVANYPDVAPAPITGLVVGFEDVA